MNHSNMYAVGLALCTFANIASEEMSRDLVNEIEKLLGSSNAYIRKKVRGTLSCLVSQALILAIVCALCTASHQESPGAHRSLRRKVKEPAHRSQSWSPAHSNNTYYRDVPDLSTCSGCIPKCELCALWFSYHLMCV